MHWSARSYLALTATGKSDAGDVRTRVGATGSVGILMSVVAAMLALIPGWWELALNVALILALGGIIAAATASLIIALPSRKLTRAESSGQDGSTLSVVRELVGAADRPSDDARTNAQPAASGALLVGTAARAPWMALSIT